ncbi:sporulation protein, YlmC/YmxH family [Desulfosporosinus acidiphilus SJ4]|uniref:Sporulation protein, YlmC/YmxH family n=1 Tax=Desulfosporosinus acidiphilus (strain DSM 22704 / JCM 16185 / SJ4) TaxID=646529 RepID=I4D9D9_DESAJ|nr:YlmC/YmxH family sporulation protein [Desulfosporosinus acidiphilus]AFM42413.1 sporulation protein, YlmC/YmxH family [Desulfosporosinus acidiphilus SJ4]
MLLSDLAGKEIINLNDGAKLGLVGDADIDISLNGKIEAIIIASRGGFSGFWSSRGDRDRDQMVIPWQTIKKVGSEVIIIDLHDKSENKR